MSRKAIYENTRSTINQAEWAERSNSYLERHRKASERIDELETARRERLGKAKIIEGFIKDISNRPPSQSLMKSCGWQSSIPPQSGGTVI